MLKRIFTKISATLLLSLLVSLTGFAQKTKTKLDENLLAIKNAININRQYQIKEVMNLPANEENAFWSIYQQYEEEKSEYVNQELVLIQKFATNYDKLTDDDVIELTKNVFAIDKKSIKLKEKYFKKMQKEISPKTAARFFQVEGQLQTLMHYKLMEYFPLIDNTPKDGK